MTPTHRACWLAVLAAGCGLLGTHGAAAEVGPSLPDYPCRWRVEAGFLAEGWTIDDRERAWELRLRQIQRCRDCASFLGGCDECSLPSLLKVSKEFAEYRRYQATKLDSQIATATSQERTDELSTLREKKRQWLEEADKYLQEAADAYLEVLGKIPAMEGRDKLLLELADHYHFSSNRPDLALAQYERLTREIPSSSLLADAYLSLGDIHFQQGDWRNADRCFRKAAPINARDFALEPSAACVSYKQAWILHRQGSFPQARTAFHRCEQLLARARGNPALRKACINDEKRLYPSSQKR